ncbi:DMT family transporter [Curvibacter delicatus]|jgi:drug/metabolite transporter (DMT)-like permease|uniref:DMT family transporter n=1 Tax=Curvibacter delicatus TaxID=80879 RepID=UPI00082A4841|nr:DMT family transporter [Curvibacter delicatus]
MSLRVPSRKSQRSPWERRLALTRHRAGRLDPAVQGLLWTLVAGICFVLLNTLSRYLTTQIDPMQSQFLRYFCGLLVMLPLVWRSGLAAYRPRHIGGQFVRGLVHTAALGLWFVALPHISLADMTAIGFTTPIFIMLGAWLFLREPMHWERWLAALVGFGGVLVVVGPGLSASGGIYSLVMLASAPVFAASFLITKALTRHEKAGVIVLWQSIAVTLLSLPLALLHWQAPTAAQWAGYMVCGLLGSGAHYCLTRSYGVVDISATLSLKFLDLVWASIMGWLVFSEQPSQSTLIGGLVISASTLWIARRESRRNA